MDNEYRKPVEFSGTFSTYLSMIGYVIGTADIWRFPFLVYRNGGGAFLIPFVITMVVCGVPLHFLEYSISKFSGKGPYRIWDICPLFRGLGISIIATYLFYIAGSSVFRGFLSVFLINAFKDPLPWTTCNNSWNSLTCRANPFLTTENTSLLQSNESVIMHPIDVAFPTVQNHTGSYIESTQVLNNTVMNGMTSTEEFWQFEALRLSTGITDFYPIQWRLILMMAILRIVVMLCAFKSIKSIEKVMYVTTFLPILVSIAVFIRSLMLPGAMAGLRRFYYPEFSKLANPRVWVEAFLMAFYSLSFGWGGLVMLGSHARFNENCIRCSILVPLVDGVVGVVSSSVCFSVLGNMAHAYNVGIDDIINAGFSLGVVSYVTALSAFPLPQLWIFIFIVAVILVALDSQIVPIEMALQIIGEMYPSLYPKYRLHILGAITLGLFVLCLPTCTGAGAYLFLWVDWYVGVWFGPICGFIEAIVVAWVYGIDRFSGDVALMIGRPIPGFYRWTIAFLSPAVVFMIFCTSIIEYVPPTYGAYVYPDWSRVLGWLVVAGLIAPTVVKAMVMLYTRTGNLRQRLKTCAAHTNEWGPKEPTARGRFERQMEVLKDRPMTQLLHYTIFGRYSKRSQIDVSATELDALHGTEKESENN